MTCLLCESYIPVDSESGECHFLPPTPLDQYRGDPGEWAIVLATDECAEFNAGSHPGTACLTCTRRSAIEFTTTGECKATVTPLGSYRGRKSENAVVNDDDPSCTSCYDAI